MLLHLPNKKGAYMAGVSMNKFEQFVENAYRGIPEQTSTVEEKEKAIAAKKKILQHPNCPKETKTALLREIATIEGEIAGIKNEQRNASMNSSMFPKRNDLG